MRVVMLVASNERITMSDNEPSEEAKALATKTQTYYLDLIFAFMGEITDTYADEDDEYAEGFNDGVQESKRKFMKIFNVEEL